MEITFKTATSDQDFEGILALQRQNLYTAISAEKQADQGFVFAEHNIQLLKKMSVNLPQIIALANNKVIGYNLSMSADMKYDLPSITPMFNAFEKCNYLSKSLTTYQFIVGGQVCVDQDFRGRGLLRKLYEETKDQLKSGFEVCVTEISTRNPNSLKAHQKMGFEVIDTYHDGIELWDIVLWDFRK